MESDHRYFSRRAAEEQRRARHAVTPAARERHKELASLFATKAAKTGQARGAAAHPRAERGSQASSARSSVRKRWCCR